MSEMTQTQAFVVMPTFEVSCQNLDVGSRVIDNPFGK